MLINIINRSVFAIWMAASIMGLPTVLDRAVQMQTSLIDITFIFIWLTLSLKYLFVGVE